MSNSKGAFKNESKIYSVTNEKLIELPDGNDDTIRDFGFGNNTIRLDVPFNKMDFINKSIIDIFSQKTSKVNSIKLKELQKPWTSIYTWYENKMTSNTTPSPLVASTSSIWNTNYDAWKAFNGTNNGETDGWCMANGTTTGWIQLDFGMQKQVNIVTLVSANYPTNATQASPKDFDIEASNDGTNFDIIHSVSGESGWTANERRSYSFNSDRDYRYWRINIQANNGHTFSRLGQLIFGHKREVN